VEDADAASYCLWEFGGTVVNAIRVTGYGGGDDGSIVSASLRACCFARGDCPGFAQFLPALSNALTVWSLLDCGSSATMRVAWSRTLRQISSSWGSISTFNDNNLICYLDKSIDAGITT
jgi:hypothetical protein